MALLVTGTASGGSLSSATNVSISSGATFDLNGNNASIGALSGSGTVTDTGAAAALNVTGGSFSGTITGTAAVSGANVSIAAPSANSLYQITVGANNSLSLSVANGLGGTLSPVGTLAARVPLNAINLQTAGATNTFKDRRRDDHHHGQWRRRSTGTSISFNGISDVIIQGNAELNTASTFSTVTVSGTATIDSNVNTTGNQALQRPGQPQRRRHPVRGGLGEHHLRQQAVNALMPAVGR